MHRFPVVSLSLALLALSLALMASCPPAARAQPPCQRTARPGVDTLQRMVDRLRRNGVGCLRAGTYTSRSQQHILRRSGITIVPLPGAVAIVKGMIWIPYGYDHVTLRHLVIDGSNTLYDGAAGQQTCQPLTTDASYTTIVDNELSNENCGNGILIRGQHHPDTTGAVVVRNRIHDVGHYGNDVPEEHAIYVSRTSGTVIRQNWIYDCGDSGVQLYPGSEGARIERNVIDDCGNGIDPAAAYSYASHATSMAQNSITNLHRNAANSGFGIFGYANSSSTLVDPSSNVARDNLFWNDPGGPFSEFLGVSYVEIDNRSADPRYLDPAGKDFRVAADSPAADLGLWDGVYASTRVRGQRRARRGR